MIQSSSTAYPGNLLRIGHRGAAGHASENTLASFEVAIKLGVDFVEFDVRRSQDGTLVLIHDRTVERTTNGRGIVEYLTLRALRQLDAGGGEKIPLLEEGLRCLNGRAGAMIELKVKGIAAETCAAVKAVQFQGAVIVASFLHQELLTVRKNMPGLFTLALFKANHMIVPASALPAYATHAGLPLRSVRAALVGTFQKRKIKVFVYTVDAPEDIARMKSLGVNGIISNFPDRV
jgi:glycerophosphoryl diester phosphodiesterase